MVVTMKDAVLWHVMPCAIVRTDVSEGQRLHHQGGNSRWAKNVSRN
jgi:hypothetical protein